MQSMTSAQRVPALFSTFEPAAEPRVRRTHARRMRPATPLAVGGRSPERPLLWCMSSPRDSISDELESLVTRFARFAGRIAHDRGLHQEDLDELLQELRVRFWRARKEGLRDLSAGYVRRAAISAALDIIRRRRVDRNVSIDDDQIGTPTLATLKAGPAELLDQSELARRVALAVDGLAPPRRAAVRMYLDGYRREEIAQLLRWSDAKTRNLLYRGLADLRATLIAQGIGTGENVQ
jgi:RNA polymerase sigma factor (sigma-70 family)